MVVDLVSHRPVTRSYAKYLKTRPFVLYLPEELLHTIAELCTLQELMSFMLANRHLYNTLYKYFVRRAAKMKNNDSKLALQAAYHGSVELLQALDRCDIPLTTPWWSEFSLHHYTDEYPHPEHIWENVRSSPAGCHIKTYSALHIALQKWNVRDATRYEGVVSYLIDKGAPVDSSCDGLCACFIGDPLALHHKVYNPHWTLLHLALCTRKGSVARLLLSKNADANNLSTRHAGCTALHTAVSSGSVDMVRLVLDSQACAIDSLDPFGNTALFLSLWLTQLRQSGSEYQNQPFPRHREAGFSTLCPRLLLAAGASLSIECPTSRLPWKAPLDTHWNDEDEDKDMEAAYLQTLGDIYTQRNYKPTSNRVTMNTGSCPPNTYRLLPIHTAAMAGNFDAMVELLDARADVNSLSAGHYPLHCAIAGCKARVVTKGFAIYHREFNTVQKLLASGADPNSKTQELARGPVKELTPGATPLMYAMGCRCSVETIQLLLDSGADARAVDSKGQTALHWFIAPLIGRSYYSPTGEQQDFPLRLRHYGEDPASQNRRRLKLLLEHGCPIDQQNILGHTFQGLVVAEMERETLMFITGAKRLSTTNRISKFNRSLRRMIDSGPQHKPRRLRDRIED